MKDHSNEILLDVKNLRKFFPIQKGFLRRVVGHVRAVDDVTFLRPQGRDAVAGGRKRLRQDDDRALHRARPQADSVARSCFNTRDGQVDIAPLPKTQPAALPRGRCR